MTQVKCYLKPQTIAIMSEFVRTPKLNAGSGTDHWQSASMILMGDTIKDNTVIGGTDDLAQAKGWENGGIGDRNDQNKILPDHIAKSIVNKLMPQADHDELGEKRLDEIFKA